MKYKDFISYHISEGRFWFRILGRGVAINDRSKWRPLFSERSGKVKSLKIGKWSIKLLNQR